MLCGTWCTPPIDAAIKAGYRIVGVEGIWHWNEGSQRTYDKVLGIDGIFSNFIDKFYKIKCESSGYPEHVKYCSKNLLNSFYGKLAQKEDKTKVDETLDE